MCCNFPQKQKIDQNYYHNFACPVCTPIMIQGRMKKAENPAVDLTLITFHLRASKKLRSLRLFVPSNMLLVGSFGGYLICLGNEVRSIRDRVVSKLMTELRNKSKKDILFRKIYEILEQSTLIEY